MSQNAMSDDYFHITILFYDTSYSASRPQVGGGDQAGESPDQMDHASPGIVLISEYYNSTYNIK